MKSTMQFPCHNKIIPGRNRENAFVIVLQIAQVELLSEIELSQRCVAIPTRLIHIRAPRCSLNGIALRRGCITLLLVSRWVKIDSN